MGVRVRVTKNRLPQVIAALRSEVDRAVDDTAEEIATVARGLAPVRTGVMVSTTEGDPAGSLHAAVEAGEKRGRGFYAIFQEFGTSKMAAQPFMTPAGQAGEPVLVEKTSDAVRRAARA